ncbi:MAG TPA: DUF1178 family protein [Microvirga sp.]|jgi:hypothetical protein|nr:DUF1178 family protein [Microvirga sp.]
MIKYALACEQAHEFESWFPSSDAFETQRKRGFVTCPVCDSSKVEKQIMAPALARRDRDPAPRPPMPEAPAPEAQPMAILSEREQHLRAMLKALREHVTKTAEHVGERFADEARKMHYGETEHRSIYGEANLEDAHALWEEGIEVHPLPILPDDRN